MAKQPQYKWLVFIYSLPPEAGSGRVDTQTITKGTTTLVSSELSYDAASNVTARAQSVYNGSSNVAGSLPLFRGQVPLRRKDGSVRPLATRRH